MAALCTMCGQDFSACNRPDCIRVKEFWQSQSIPSTEVTMNEYRVHWHQCPHIRFDPRVMFVMAGDEETARAIAKDHVERTYGIEWFTIKSCTEYTRPTGGSVVP